MGMTLADRLLELNAIQARRYGRLSGVALVIATAGIERHFIACDSLGVEPDIDAVREIIDDALNGRAVYKEMEGQRRRPAYDKANKRVE